PRLRHAVVRREHRRLEQRLEFLARDRPAGEPLHRAARANRRLYVHVPPIPCRPPAAPAPARCQSAATSAAFTCFRAASQRSRAAPSWSAFHTRGGENGSASMRTPTASWIAFAIAGIDGCS